MPIEKTCPRCGVKHKKRGPFCSRSCGNVREHTEEDKEVRRQKLIEYHQTPEGAATRAKASAQITALNKGQEMTIIPMEDYAVDIPEIPDQSILDDWFDGFDRGEKW
jgi:endogenous inhibitor of DNA gyrase (YacG/DUF329 family)